jgi:hypothetical protein
VSKRRVIILVVLAAILVAVGALLKQASASKQEAQSMSCAGRMFPICLAGQLYASDHAGRFPTNFVSMKDFLMTTKVLVCPSDGRRKPAKSWETFTDENTSYLIVNPRVLDSAKDEVFIRCRVHGHVGYPDRTVFDGKRRRGKFQ